MLAPSETTFVSVPFQTGGRSKKKYVYLAECCKPVIPCFLKVDRVLFLLWNLFVQSCTSEMNLKKTTETLKDYFVALTSGDVLPPCNIETFLELKGSKCFSSIADRKRSALHAFSHQNELKSVFQFHAY